MTAIADYFGLDLSDRWMQDAACREVGSQPFFDDEHEGHYRQAIAVCGSCSVRQECLDYALTNDLRHGVFGGLTPVQRRIAAGLDPQCTRGHERTDSNTRIDGKGVAQCMQCKRHNEKERVRRMRAAA